MAFVVMLNEVKHLPDYRTKDQQIFRFVVTSLNMT